MGSRIQRLSPIGTFTYKCIHLHFQMDENNYFFHFNSDCESTNCLTYKNIFDNFPRGIFDFRLLKYSILCRVVHEDLCGTLPCQDLPKNHTIAVAKIILILFKDFILETYVTTLDPFILAIQM